MRNCSIVPARKTECSHVILYNMTKTSVAEFVERMGKYIKERRIGSYKRDTITR